MTIHNWMHRRYIFFTHMAQRQKLATITKLAYIILQIHMYRVLTVHISISCHYAYRDFLIYPNFLPLRIQWFPHISKFLATKEYKRTIAFLHHSDQYHYGTFLLIISTNLNLAIRVYSNKESINILCVTW